jgi:hypothetical protein
MLAVMATTSLSALPVTWESTFGASNGFDDALGLTLSTSCGPRYAVAGRALSASWISDLYVFLSDENGATATALGFENIYDIGGLHGHDGANAIRDTGDGGFIVTGTVDVGGGSTGPSRLILLKLECSGAVSWVRTYGEPDGNYVARDVIVNDDGDYTAAGWRQDRKSGLREAFLVRVSATGVQRWNHTYRGVRGSGFTSDNGFYSLTQNSRMPGQITGDITAVGFTSRPSAARDGWVVRVDGATGLFGAPPQGGAFYSSAGNEDFDAVRELRVPPETGRLVYAGHTTLPPLNESDIYLVKSTQLPWAPLVQVGIGDFGGPSHESGMSFVEMTANTPFSQAGDLALTGVVNPPGQFEAFLLKIDKGTLGPTNIGALGTPGFRYGDHGQLDDGGYNIVYDNHSNPDYIGFAIVGFSKGNLEMAAPPDPNDVYLLKTDPLGRTGCEIPYAPYKRDMPYTVQQDTIEIRDPAQEDAPTVEVTPVDWGKRVCPK